MSESVNNREKSSFGATVAQYAAFPAVFTGIPALNCAIRHRGIKNAIEAKDIKAFKDLDIKLKQNGSDWFSKNTILNESYQYINDKVKTSQKLTNKIAKAQKGKLPITKRISSFLKGEDSDTALKNYKAMLENNKSVADNAIEAGKNAMKDGKSAITHEAKGLGKFKTFVNKITDKDIFKTKTFDEAFENSAKGTLKRVVKNDMFSGFDIFMAVISASKDIKEVPSAFKEGGFKAGMKQIGKACVSFGVDLVGYGASGFAGRTVGSVIGNIIAPGVGGAVGGQIGGMLGSMVIGGKIETAVDKALGYDDEDDTEAKDGGQNSARAENIQSSNISETSVSKEQHYKNSPQAQQNFNRLDYSV